MLAAWLLFLLLISIFCVVFPGINEYFELPKVIVLILLTPLILLHSDSIPYNQNDAKKLFASRSFQFLALFIVSLSLSSFLGGTMDSLIGQPYRYQGIFFFTMLFAIALIVRTVVQKEKYLEKIYVGVVFGSILNVISILFQGIFFFLGSTVINFDGRMTGLIGNPNFAGGALALSFPYVFAYCKHRYKLLLLLTLSWAAAIYLTDSRGALIAFSLSLVFLVSYQLRRSAVFGLTAAILLFFFFFFPQRAVSSFDSRMIIWQKGWQAVQKKPLLGWGLENFHTAFQSVLDPTGDFDLKAIKVDKAHNEFLEMLVSGGVVGLFFYLGMILSTAWILWKNRLTSGVFTQLIVLCIFCILAQVNVVNVTEYIFLFISVGYASSLEGKTGVFKPARR